jgi:hypothetical protein
MDLPADSRLSHKQILGSKGDAHAPPNGDKATQKVYRRYLGEGG